jgi:hypothetical protein
MGHFSMEIYAPNGSNLSGNQHSFVSVPRIACVCNFANWDSAVIAGTSWGYSVSTQ